MSWVLTSQSSVQRWPASDGWWWSHHRCDGHGVLDSPARANHRDGRFYPQQYDCPPPASFHMLFVTDDMDSDKITFRTDYFMYETDTVKWMKTFSPIMFLNKFFYICKNEMWVNSLSEYKYAVVLPSSSLSVDLICNFFFTWGDPEAVQMIWRQLKRQRMGL